MKAKCFLFKLTVVFSVSIFLSPATTAAQANLEKAIDRYIERIRDDAEEYKEDRKIVFGDVSGDGRKDAVVQYTLEGAGGGNSWGQNLAVFFNVKGVYKMTADEAVGGKFFRTFNLLKVAGKQIIGESETCPDDEPQGLCENPKKKQVKYVLIKGKLTEN